MKIPALRAKIGDWTYYITTLTFEQVDQSVSRIDDQLHKSESLKDLIQRSITNNYISIKNYILNQPEVFFNSLVLAVYDEYPNWREIEFKYDDNEVYQMGLLEFPGEHKIFPVDGQHRVEGIKAAIKENPELKEYRVAAIFIGHKNNTSGKQRTRRLFTTLNRYAKPVKPDDIIALDEDDMVAITTRYLLEEYDLFTGKRVVYAGQKSIPSNNKEAITSIITLYQANIELFKIFYEETFGKKVTKKILEEFLKFRPPDNTLLAFQELCCKYWDAFKSNIDIVKDYIKIDDSPAEKYRNKQTGGSLLFRPVGLLPFVKASITIKKHTNLSFGAIFKKFNDVNLNINSKPWHYVIWNPIENKMIMNSATVTYLLLCYLYDKSLLNDRELKKLKEGYASKISFEGDISNILDGI